MPKETVTSKHRHIRGSRSYWTHAAPVLGLATGLAVLASVFKTRFNETNDVIDLALPPQTMFVDPRSFSVLPPSISNRDGPYSTPYFNPTNTTPPFFQMFHRDFLRVLGKKPYILEVAMNDTFAFAHEAPIWVEETGDVWFCSMDGGALGYSDWDNNSRVGRISMRDVEAGLSIRDDPYLIKKLNVPVEMLEIDSLQMTNGGSGPYRGQLLWITSGRGHHHPPSIVLQNPRPPFNTTVLLNNFYGRQFNSLNDIKIHPNGKFFFTDTIYGSINRFRPTPMMPNQVYSFDVETGETRVVADGFVHSNGIAFSQDGKTAYIADTGVAGGNSTMGPATIYTFDVQNSGTFTNRRIFAFIDAGVPDGLQLDAEGNVYSGTADGVSVWNPDGRLLGKFFTGQISANMVFAGDGRLVILAETKIYVAHIAAKGFALSPV